MNDSAKTAPAAPRSPDVSAPTGKGGPQEAAAPRVRDSEAEYTLEYRVRCPYCSQSINSLSVVRLLRTRVNFTSTLPRRGRVIVCPECRKIVSAELAGFA